MVRWNLKSLNSFRRNKLPLGTGGVPVMLLTVSDYDLLEKKIIL